MPTFKTARERARDEIQREIMRAARDQLADVGAAALSLRAVARELGMVSSAIYRYVASRDELLTRLIDDAYNSLGGAVEADVAASRDDAPLERWVRAGRIVRSWALERPHEYALLYGSPVPGYAAPEQTAVSGTRVSRALVGIVRDARHDRRLRDRGTPEIEVPEALQGDFEALRADVDLDVADDVVLDVLIAWTQLFGLVSFEVFGQTRGLVEHHAQLFETATRRLAGLIGLP